MTIPVIKQILILSKWFSRISAQLSTGHLRSFSQKREQLQSIHPAESINSFCFICGSTTFFDSYEPIDTPCKRNSFICRKCGSIARNRHVAKIILELCPTSPKSNSLKEFARRTDLTILHTCNSGAIHEELKVGSGYRVSEFYDNIPSGDYVKGVQCQNLEKTTYEDDSMDIIITEDVFEHISSPEQACCELRRILKPGGLHISTISVDWSNPRSVVRARLSNGQVEHILSPVYHGDPFRKEGALVFVDFGADIVERYLSKTGKTDVFWSNGNKYDEQHYAIFHNMVFVSTKTDK
jgi:SAM-dependent methyltransferase